MGKLLTEHYVLVALDVMERGEKKVLENPGANEFMDTMGGTNAGLPFCVFLDKEENKIADSKVMPEDQNFGYPAAAEEIAAFGALLKRTAPRMTPEQQTKIADWFTRNTPRAQGSH